MLLYSATAGRRVHNGSVGDVSFSPPDRKKVLATIHTISQRAKYDITRKPYRATVSISNLVSFRPRTMRHAVHRGSLPDNRAPARGYGRLRNSNCLPWMLLPQHCGCPCDCLFRPCRSRRCPCRSPNNCSHRRGGLIERQALFPVCHQIFVKPFVIATRKLCPCTPEHCATHKFRRNRHEIRIFRYISSEKIRLKLSQLKERDHDGHDIRI